jgi:DNA (cytosine-5)-methyltransferase 1
MSTQNNQHSVVGLCSGAGGLDLGFEQAGFHHKHAIDLNPWAIATLQQNRPQWSVTQTDLKDFELSQTDAPDVLLAGVPCQGFSLGGNRQNHDPRNQLYKQVLRITAQSKPRVVVIENVLNLRTMRSPDTDKPFAVQIADDLKQCGYQVFYGIFKMCHYGVPQTRRRFVFVAFYGAAPLGYTLPQPDDHITPIRSFLFDLAHETNCPPRTTNSPDHTLPNHDPQWGFKSAVHLATGKSFAEGDHVFPVRFSRTASDGNPLRSYDEPFPAIDTATVWGWAQGHVKAERREKDRQTGKHVRNPQARIKLWRISASRLRSFTHREYARLQTFPDDWVFCGGNKRDVHMQIGNAVPVEFARRLGENISQALVCLDQGNAIPEGSGSYQLSLLPQMV